MLLREPNPRARLITLVRYGKVTPEQAEAEAVARGWPPFERMPEAGKFNPMLETRWPIVMAIAWIAWRDIELTRQHAADFRAECTHWIFREWDQPVKRGTAFAPRAGWFLEQWSQTTTVRLSFMDHLLASKGNSPASQQMSVNEAEMELWRSLSVGDLIAEAIDATGKPVDIAEREWSYLKLYEDSDSDVLRYEVLDRSEPFTRVNLRRSDLFRLWPAAVSTAKAEQDCYRWLFNQMRASPTRKPKARTKFWSEAKERFPTLAKRQFVRAWERAIADSGASVWAKAGRLPEESNRSAK